LLQCALELSGRKLRSYGTLVISTIIHRFAEVGGITPTYHYPKSYATSTEGGGISSLIGGFNLSLTSGEFTKYAQHFTTTTRDVKRNEKLRWVHVTSNHKLFTRPHRPQSHTNINISTTIFLLKAFFITLSTYAVGDISHKM